MNQELPVTDAYDKMGKDELIAEHAKVEDRWFRLIDELQGNRERALEQLLSHLQAGVRLTKSILFPDNRAVGIFQPEDEVEFRVEAGTPPVMLVRNATLAAQTETERPVIEGTIREIPHAEIVATVEAFIEQVDERKIGVHKLEKNIITEVTRDSDARRQKMLIVEDDMGKILGIAYYKEQSSQSAYIEILATDPEVQESGVGSVLLDELKQRYGDLTLKAVPFSPHLGGHEANTKLQDYYRKRGFLGSASWSRRAPSIDDRAMAGEWIPLVYGDIYHVGVGDQRLSPSTLVETLLGRLAQGDDMDQYAPGQAIEVARQWDQENQRIEREMEANRQTSHQMLQAIRRKERAEREARRGV